MKELGSYLKQTRIGNGVSITEACEDLDFSTSYLENIESGNVKAFKDVYELRDAVKLYAKYLGLNSDKVVDEFNGFLFQHTSKISLDDIMTAQKKKDSSKKNISSPYTKEYKEKVNIWPLFVFFIGLFLILLLIYVVLNYNSNIPKRVDELRINIGRESVYEFTY